MPTTVPTIPAPRVVVIYDAGDLPDGCVVTDRDTVEGEECDRHRSAFQHFPVRLSVIESGTEIDRLWTFEPRSAALTDVAAHPGRQYGLVLGVELRNATTGASITVA